MTMQATPRERLMDFIAQTSELLDAEAFDEFLARCSPEFRYQVTAQSPELGIRMTWLDHDRKAFEMMVRLLRDHVRVDAAFSRHVSVTSVSSADPAAVMVRSKVAVFQTDPNGTSTVLAIGTYHDVVDTVDAERPRLRSRELRLDTRDLGPGVHVPL